MKIVIAGCGKVGTALAEHLCEEKHDIVVIDPDETYLDQYERSLPYEVLRADASAHIVKDKISGITGCAAFETVMVDENILSLSPSVMMYEIDNGQINISVSNPDLALYTGEADEIFDEDGKRKERSVYGRKWVNNPAAPTEVNIILNGKWTASDHDNIETLERTDIRTVIKVNTSECRTETIKLNKEFTN